MMFLASDEIDLETRIRDMLVVAPDDSDMRRHAANLAARYRQVREKFGEENAERDLGEMVNRFWRPGCPAQAKATIKPSKRTYKAYPGKGG